MSNQGRRRFERNILELLDREREVEVETTGADGSRRRAIIWVVVDGDEVFVRSFLGDRGRWYRDLLARPGGALLSDGRRVEFTAVRTADADSVERCSRGFERKYRRGRSLSAMLRPEVLGTTLRLDPVES